MVAGLLLAPGRAEGAGLYYSERGVRPLGRGGAFVAGADDLGAIAFNPAGLADAGSQLLVDFAYVDVKTEFTRQTVVKDAVGNETVQTSPTVTGKTPFLPIPTLAASFHPKNSIFTFALGVYAPYAALQSWPLTGPDGQPAASRYSLVSPEGSVLAITGAYVAVKPIEQLRIGLGLDALVGALDTEVVFSASPQDRLLAAPESPQYDSLTKLKTKMIFAPSATLGVTIVPVKQVRIGLAFHLPYHVDVPAELNVNLPSATAFESARQEGSSVRVKTDLPATLRAGVEVRPTDDVRVELAYVREQWNAHRSIDVTPEDVRFFGVTGFPSPFPVPPVSIQRNFKASNSVRLGGEVTVLHDPGLDLRAGINYDASAIPNDYLSAFTADLNRLTLAMGAGIRPNAHWRIDALYAHIFGFTREVDPVTAGISPVNPVRGNPVVPQPINGGTYANRGNVFGLGAQYKF